MRPKTTFALFDNLSWKQAVITLYRTDLEHLIKLGVDRGFTVALSDDSDIFDGLDDIKENRGDKVKSLTIAYNEGLLVSPVTLRIGGGKIKITSARNDKFIPLWHDLKLAIEKRTPIQAPIMKPALWSFLTIVYFFIEPQTTLIPKGGYLGIGIFLLLGYMWVLSAHYAIQNSVVYLIKQHEVKTWKDKYGDKEKEEHKRLQISVTKRGK